MKKFLAVAIVVLAALPLASSAQASTAGQRNALGSAKEYLSSQAFSKRALVHQLESPYGGDFSHADATWGVAHVHANWSAQAVRSAKEYLRSQSFSRNGLIHQLESPYGGMFTHAQAVYGVSVAYR